MEELAIIVKMLKQNLSDKEAAIEKDGKTLDLTLHSLIANRKRDILFLEERSRQVNASPMEKIPIIANFKKDAEAIKVAIAEIGG